MFADRVLLLELKLSPVHRPDRRECDEFICDSRALMMLKQFLNDEHGVILSAELVLVGTVLILGMIVGLVELQCAVVAELSDLGDAIGNVDQSYRIPGITSYKSNGGVKAQTAGAAFNDRPDAGDCNSIITCDNAVGGDEKSSLSGGGFGTAGSYGHRSQDSARRFGDLPLKGPFGRGGNPADHQSRGRVFGPDTGDEYCPPDQLQQRNPHELNRQNSDVRPDGQHERRSARDPEQTGERRHDSRPEAHGPERAVDPHRGPIQPNELRRTQPEHDRKDDDKRPETQRPRIRPQGMI